MRVRRAVEGGNPFQQGIYPKLSAGPLENLGIWLDEGFAESSGLNYGIMVYSLLWVMQDFVHQPYVLCRTDKAGQVDTDGCVKKMVRPKP